MTLQIVAAAPDRLAEWRSVHNEIIPTAPLGEDEVADRAARHLLTVAYRTTPWSAVRPSALP